jgi:hypothetical protein
MNAGIVLEDVTVIDLARWSFSGNRFVGDSLNVHCMLKGAVTPDEGVILDFSAGKRQIKAAIDAHVAPALESSPEQLAQLNGFDHKIVLPTKPEFRELVADEASKFSQLAVEAHRVSDTHARVTIDSGHRLSLTVPINALRLVPADVLFDLDARELLSLATLIATHLEKTLPALRVEVGCDQEPRVRFIKGLFGPTPFIESFCYTHGLPVSSSVGCQNIMHGHRSFVASGDIATSQRIAGYLNDAYLYNAAYRTTEATEFSYESSARGGFRYESNPDGHTRFIGLRAEPTVENIAAHVAEKLRITAPFFVSEGLQKGCYVAP